MLFKNDFDSLNYHKRYIQLTLEKNIKNCNVIITKVEEDNPKPTTYKIKRIIFTEDHYIFWEFKNKDYLYTNYGYVLLRLFENGRVLKGKLIGRSRNFPSEVVFGEILLRRK